MKKLLFVSALFFSYIPLGLSQSFDSAGIARKIAPAVVLIKGTTDKGDVQGSGFIISSDGKIATNLHVLRDLRKAGVQLASGEKYDSFSVVAFDERKDIAIIKIPGFDLPTVNLGNSNSIQIAEPVLIVGSPLGLQGSVTTGVVSSIRDDPTGGGFKVLQTDAAANPGNSGGPLINRQSEVIGILTFKIAGGENLNFAIPVNYLRGLMETSLSAMSLEQLRAGLANTTDVFNSEGFPRRWKSLTSGLTKIIRRDADHLYVESVLPEEAKQAGCFTLSELQKSGSSFAGTTNESCVCQYQKRIALLGWEPTLNHYRVQYPIEISVLTPTRIEGRTSERKLDCANGTLAKEPSAWQTFSWIPE